MLNSLSTAAEGNGNLLAAAVDAARARCTVGEISDAVEKVLGRHQPDLRVVSGAYATEFGASDEMAQTKKVVDDFEASHGRRPRLIVAKVDSWRNGLSWLTTCS